MTPVTARLLTSACDQSHTRRQKLVNSRCHYGWDLAVRALDFRRYWRCLFGLSDFSRAGVAVAAKWRRICRCFCCCVAFVGGKRAAKAAVTPSGGARWDNAPPPRRGRGRRRRKWSVSGHGGRAAAQMEGWRAEPAASAWDNRWLMWRDQKHGLAETTERCREIPHKSRVLEPRIHEQKIEEVWKFDTWSKLKFYLM